MGWIKNIGRTITKGVKDVGHTVGKVADNKIVQGVTAAALAASGVGAPAAAGILAAQAAGGKLLKPGGNIGQAAKAGAINGGLGALGGVVGKIPGVSSLGSELGKIPGVSTIGHAIGGVGGALGRIPGVSEIGGAIGNAAGHLDLGGIADAAGGFLKDHGDQLLQGAGAVTSALDAKSARDLENKALGIANGNWEARAPLRVAGVNGMANSAPPDLSALYSDTGNPYTRAKKVKGVSQGVLS
jgi:hypothetical protein